MKPFIQWAGGKAQLLSKLKVLLSYNRYFEPFIGGGALLLNLAPKNAVINDVNSDLINLYLQIRDNTDAFIERVRELDEIDCTNEIYLEKRRQYNEETDKLNKAALMMWLNKRCFNGLYRVNKKGEFNSSYGKKDGKRSSFDESNLREVAAYLSNVEIRMGDFYDVAASTQAGDFVYFDSPYFPESETANFTRYTKEGFSFEDQKRLASLAKELSARGVYVELSNNNVPLVYELYDGFIIEEVDARRAINRDGTKRKGKEVIIRNEFLY